MPTIVLNAEMSCGAAQNSTTCASMLRDRSTPSSRRSYNVASNARDGRDHTRRCGGCSGAITRILTKVDGVNKVEPDLETQKVTVDVADGSGIDGDALLEKLAAWANSAGKKVSVAA